MPPVAKPVLLCILDGWGLAPKGPGNAAALARTPHLDALFASSPHTTLQASGEAVGLPAGQMGNSEVGHLNLGAGRVVYQDLVRISRDIENGSFFTRPALTSLAEALQRSGGTLHLMGLVSDGGVHSHNDHLYALLDWAKQKGLTKVKVHAVTDGRDVPPDSGLGYIRELEKALKRRGLGQIATVSGRYYAMDRDNRWDRVERAWQAVVEGTGAQAADAETCIRDSYAGGVTDEFILPTVIGDSAPVQDGDGMIFFNFRADRAREICQAFIKPAFDGFARPRFPTIALRTMTEYAADLLPAEAVIYPPAEIKNTLGAWLAHLGKRQLRTAETEKYAHVTFFFNGGVEEPNPNEQRRLVPSPKVATYDLAPEMSAAEVAQGVVEALDSSDYDFILVNFANPDMVGHTGILDAAVQAVEAVDTAIGRIVEALEKADGVMLICADHGNCETMQDPEGKPVTSHTTNPVPLLLVPGQGRRLHSGALCDIAPTLLDLMNCPQPAEMTGCSLLEGDQHA